MPLSITQINQRLQALEARLPVSWSWVDRIDVIPTPREHQVVFVSDKEGQNAKLVVVSQGRKYVLEGFQETPDNQIVGAPDFAINRITSSPFGSGGTFTGPRAFQHAGVFSSTTRGWVMDRTGSIIGIGASIGSPIVTTPGNLRINVLINNNIQFYVDQYVAGAGDIVAIQTRKAGLAPFSPLDVISVTATFHSGGSPPTMLAATIGLTTADIQIQYDD